MLKSKETQFLINMKFPNTKISNNTGIHKKCARARACVCVCCVCVCVCVCVRCSMTLSTAMTASSASCLKQIQPLVRTLGYRRFVLYSTLGHMEGSNSCGGYTLMGVATTQPHFVGGLLFGDSGRHT